MSTFEKLLVWSGLPFALASGYLGMRLVIEQTFWTWERGLQMVGFSLAHGLGILLFPIIVLGFIWAVLYIVYSIWWRFSGGIIGTTFIMIFIAGVVLMNIPYSFWQHTFIDKLVESPHTHQFLESAVYQGDIEMIQSMLKKGVSVNIKDRRGETPLHFAVKSQKVKIVKFLVEQGADINAISDEGDTALFLAESFAESAELKGEDFKGFSKIIEFLKQKGALSRAGTNEQREKVRKRILCEDIRIMDQKAVEQGYIDLPSSSWGCISQ